MSWTTSDTKSRARSVVQILARQLIAYKNIQIFSKVIHKSVYTVNGVERWFCQNFYQRFSKSALKSGYTVNWVASWLFENFYQIFSNIVPTVIIYIKLSSELTVANFCADFCEFLYRFSTYCCSCTCAHTHKHTRTHLPARTHKQDPPHTGWHLRISVSLLNLMSHTHVHAHTRTHSLSRTHTHGICDFLYLYSI